MKDVPRITISDDEGRGQVKDDSNQINEKNEIKP